MLRVAAFCCGQGAGANDAVACLNSIAKFLLSLSKSLGKTRGRRCQVFNMCLEAPTQTRMVHINSHLDMSTRKLAIKTHTHVAFASVDDRPDPVLSESAKVGLVKQSELRTYQSHKMELVINGLKAHLPISCVMPETAARTSREMKRPGWIVPCMRWKPLACPRFQCSFA